MSIAQCKAARRRIHNDIRYRKKRLRAEAKRTNTRTVKTTAKK